MNDKTDANHKVFNCKKITTPQSKLSKLKELGGCTRCGFLGHKVDNCNFRFNGRCINCKTFHAYFHCTKTNKVVNEGYSSGSTQSGKKWGSNAMQSSTSATELVVMQSYAAKSDNLLPIDTRTFGCFTIPLPNLHLLQRSYSKKLSTRLHEKITMSGGVKFGVFVDVRRLLHKSGAPWN